MCVGDAQTQLKELEKVGLGKPILVKYNFFNLGLSVASLWNSV